MDTEDVWKLIAQARAGLGEDAEDAEAVAERLVDLLEEREPAEIVAFAQPLWDLLAMSYRTELWAAAYLINGGCSDDGFEYFRGWLIAQGRTVYQQALSDPDSLAGVPAILAAHAEDNDNVECEAILSVAWDAYEAATGEELPKDAYQVSYPELDFSFDFEDHDEMRRRLPRLTTLYYGAIS
ncbi:DUF4240 domain-containing protein [Catelliglobosispora koreensis]|uniref:DUF4240 domain-containing protein n=1 Tax=Catelliglobosispora koreensis TaxID=129052 RepID=UPI00036AA48A|nr:DUF4240 domain-containing protein [Catelliglobosispora koreensis]